MWGHQVWEECAVSGMSGVDGWGVGASSGSWNPPRLSPTYQANAALNCEFWRAQVSAAPARIHAHAGVSLPCTLVRSCTLTKSVMLCADTAKRVPPCVAERKWSGVIGPGYGNAGPSAVFMLSAKGGRCGSHYHSFLTASTKDRKFLGVHKNASFLRAQLYTSRDFSWGIKGIFQAVSSSLFKTSAAKHLPILFSLLFFFLFFLALICIFYSIQMHLEGWRPNKTTNQILNI